MPPELIAQEPVAPRDCARLLVYDRATGNVSFAVFRDIGQFLPKNCVLVLNETKVIPARLRLVRPTGGGVSILVLGDQEGLVRVWADRKLHAGEHLRLTDAEGFDVLQNVEKEWILRPTFPVERLLSLLDTHGHMPLPPYIKHTPLSAQEQRTAYQSVFARTEGSIAAPTASLHFTETLLDSLRAQGITIAKVTLHVHLGTFAPLTEEQLQTGTLHREEYSIPQETIAILDQAKASGRPIIAVGTTVMRTLESSVDDAGKIVRPEGETTLFIRDGYRFRLASGLITNFHVPRSSLLMLVSALVGREKLFSLYQQAIAERFRFFSFGDAMLIV